jgi:hypothetical protein
VAKSVSVLQSSGFAELINTMGSSLPAAAHATPAGHLWWIEHHEGPSGETVRRIVDALANMSPSELASPQWMAKALDLHPDLIEQVLRELTREGKARILQDSGDLIVEPTELFWRDRQSEVPREST